MVFKRLLMLGLGAALALASYNVPLWAAGLDSQKSIMPSAYVAGELVVKFSNEAGPVVAAIETESTTRIMHTGIESLDALFTTYGVTGKRPLSVTRNLEHVYLLTLSSEADIQAAAEAFTADHSIEYAHPNYRVQAYSHLPRRR